MAPTYSFPILGNHEIIACLGELDIPLTEQDLLKPHTDTLYNAYEEMVVLLCGETRDTMYAPELDAVDVLEFPELYEEAIGNLKFTRRLFDLMRRCGVPDFTLRDLTKPEYSRTRRNVSAVINFAKFREEKVATYEAANEESVAMEQRYSSAKRKNADLKAQIKRLEIAKLSEKETEDETRSAIEKLKVVRADVESRRDAAVRKKIAAQQELDVLHDEVNVGSSDLQKAETEKMELEGKISTVDPEMTKLLKELTAKCADAQRGLDAATAETRELEAKAVGMKETSRDIQKTSEYMEEVVVAHQKKKEASTKTKDAKVKKSQMEEKQYEIEAKVETLRRQEANVLDKFNRLKSQGELKRQAAEASLVSAKEEREALVARRTANGAARSQTSEKLVTLVAQMEQLKREHASEVQSLLTNFQSLREQVSSYHAQLADVMDVPENKRVPLAVVERDGNGEFTHTYNWTNYDTVHFGGIGKGKPSLAPGLAGVP